MLYSILKRVRDKCNYLLERNVMTRPAIPIPAIRVSGERGDFAVVGSAGGARVVTTGAAVVADAGVVPGEINWNVHLVKASSTPGRLKADERVAAAAASWTLPVPVKLKISAPVLALIT